MTKKRIYTFGDNKVIYYKAYVSPYEEDETRKIKDEYIKPQGKFYNPEEALLLGNIERNKYKPFKNSLTITFLKPTEARSDNLTEENEKLMQIISHNLEKRK